MLKTIGIIVLAFIFLAVISYLTIGVATAPHSSPSPNSSTPTTSPIFSPVATTNAIPSASSAEQQTVKLYLVALEDQGKSGPKIGCGDSVVAVDRMITKTPAVLKATLDELLSLKKESYQQAGLYSAFYNSNLKTESVAITNGKATIKLTGTLSLGGVCDSPRVQEQLLQTSKQFPTVKEVEIFINNQPLAEVLSEKG